MTLFPCKFRCTKLKTEALEKGQKAEVCYVGPNTVGQLDSDAKDPDPEACRALLVETQKKCNKTGGEKLCKTF